MGNPAKTLIQFLTFTAVLMVDTESLTATPDEKGHPFIESLISANADGIVVLLPPANPVANEQTQLLFTGKAIPKDLTGAKVLLINPESASPAERALIKQYGLGESATTLLLDNKGRPYGADLGIASSEEALTKFLNDCLRARNKRDEALKNWDAAPGEASVKFLDIALSAVPDSYWVPFYSSELDALINAAGKETSLRQKYETFLTNQRKQAHIRNLLNATYEKLGPNSAVDDFLKHFNEELAARKLPPESLQLAEMHRFRYLAQAHRYEDALKTLDLAESLAPGTELAKNIPRFRDRIKVAMQKQNAKTEESPAPNGKEPLAEKPREKEAPR